MDNKFELCESDIYDKYLAEYPNLLTIFLKNGKTISVNYFYDKKNKEHMIRFSGFGEVAGYSNGVFALIPYIIADAN